MPSFRNLCTAATLAFLSSAHVVLENPKPYKFVGDGKTNPVSSTGSDFPCKIPPGQSYEIDGEPTEMVIGEDQYASFQGQAVHGGGSCQFALTRGYPTKDSAWMVIHSIEGGCPARNQKGNLDGKPNVDKYKFQIPEGIEPGTNWTFAWTWLSRVGGQPEFYMNCSPLTILASKKKRMSLESRRQALLPRASFPDLFMANMGEVSGGCTTNDALRAQIPIKFPNPGMSVEQPEGPNLFEQECDGNPRAKQAGSPASDQTVSSSPPSSATSAMSATTNFVTSPGATISSPNYSSASPGITSATTSEGLTGGPGVVFSTTFSTIISSTTDVSSVTTLGTASTIPSKTAVPSSLPTTTVGKCTEGYLTCMDDGRHFATCTGGKLTAPQPIAPGYKCEPGEDVGLMTSPQ
ncbi:hypothetical protein GGR57DRAFT_495722 [Xylariaceae sp. FL1272]|nr:hypothetical protein GGR57DRAFT_495722 [Xylariaceae sp. FL1272]